MRGGKQPRFFVLGIQHALALSADQEPDVRPKGAFSMRGHSIGGYGSVTTNKVIATIVGDLFGLQVQAYPMYGSEKKGLPTTYFLTVAEEPIRAHAELRHVDFVPLNNVMLLIWEIRSPALCQEARFLSSIKAAIPRRFGIQFPGAQGVYPPQSNSSSSFRCG